MRKFILIDDYIPTLTAGREMVPKLYSALLEKGIDVKLLYVATTSSGLHFSRLKTWEGPLNEDFFKERNFTFMDSPRFMEEGEDDRQELFEDQIGKYNGMVRGSLHLVSLASMANVVRELPIEIEVLDGDHRIMQEQKLKSVDTVMFDKYHDLPLMSILTLSKSENDPEKPADHELTPRKNILSEEQLDAYVAQVAELISSVSECSDDEIISEFSKERLAERGFPTNLLELAPLTQNPEVQL